MVNRICKKIERQIKNQTTKKLVRSKKIRNCEKTAAKRKETINIRKTKWWTDKICEKHKVKKTGKKLYEKYKKKQYEIKSPKQKSQTLK